MMKKPLLMLMLLVSHGAIAQGRLPACPGSYGTDWTNCSGTVIAPNGDKYVGEFKDDRFHGQGTLISANGHKYAGEFRDGARSGPGTKYGADGKALRSGVF